MTPSNSTKIYRLTRAAELPSLEAFRALVEQACKEQGYAEKPSYDLMLAVDEAATNVVQHSYAGMDPGSMILELFFSGQRAIVRLTDFGVPFEPHEPAKPDVVANFEQGIIGGFGLHFIYQTMDEVSYESHEDGNTLVLVKQIGGA